MPEYRPLSYQLLIEEDNPTAHRRRKDRIPVSQATYQLSHPALYTTVSADSVFKKYFRRSRRHISLLDIRNFMRFQVPHRRGSEPFVERKDCPYVPESLYDALQRAHHLQEQRASVPQGSACKRNGRRAWSRIATFSARMPSSRTSSRAIDDTVLLSTTSTIFASFLATA